MHAQDKADDLRAGTTRIRFNWVQRAVVSDNDMYNIPYIVTHKRRASDTMIYGYIDPTGLHCIYNVRLLYWHPAHDEHSYEYSRAQILERPRSLGLW